MSGLLSIEPARPGSAAGASVAGRRLASGACVLIAVTASRKRAQWRTGVFTLDAYAGLAAWGRAASLTTVPALAPAWLTAGSTLIRGTGQAGGLCGPSAVRHLTTSLILSMPLPGLRGYNPLRRYRQPS